jgi:Phosphate/sulphate permeases
VSYAVMTAIMLLFWRANRHSVSRYFEKLQILSSAFMATSHGLNDAQKTMGVITLALFLFHQIDTIHVPLWVKLACALAMAMGTALGGWKIVKTMGHKIFKLEPYTASRPRLGGPGHHRRLPHGRAHLHHPHHQRLRLWRRFDQAPLRSALGHCRQPCHGLDSDHSRLGLHGQHMFLSVRTPGHRRLDFARAISAVRFTTAPESPYTTFTQAGGARWAERGLDPDPLNLTQFMLPEESWF